MAVTHDAIVRNSLANTILSAIDQGSPGGTLEFRGSGGSPAAALTLADPAGTIVGSPPGAVLTFSSITSDTNADGGTVDRFTILDAAGVEILSGNVQTSGGDINLSSLTIGAGDTVSISSLTYTAPL